MAAEYARLYPGEVARSLESEPIDGVAAFLSGIEHTCASRVFQRLTTSVAARVLARLPEPVASGTLRRLDPARMAAILAMVDPPVVDRVLAPLSPSEAAELRDLMTYPPETAGGLMNTRVETFSPDARVDQVLNRLRTRTGDRISDVVLVDTAGRLVGTVAVEDLALAAPDTVASRLSKPGRVAVTVMTAREDLVEAMTRTGVRSIPVVDAEDRVLGVVRQDGLVRAVGEELSANLQTMVGASKEERALSPVGFAVRKRMPWLQVNLLTAFLAASVVGVFENTIAQVTALAVLLPVVAGQSGNTGAQALAVTMRGLALREIRLQHWRAVSFKEATVALVNGVSVAVTTALGVFVWSRSAGLALVIAASMIISMAAAGLAGAAVPLALTALKQDPAQSSSIILTTVTDIVGFFSFLGLATLMMARL